MEQIYVNNKFSKFIDFVLNRKPAGEIRREYNIPEKINFVFNIKSGGWLVVTSPDLPGLITEAKDFKSLMRMVNDAVLTYFDVPKHKADEVFSQLTINGVGTISTANHKYRMAG